MTDEYKIVKAYNKKAQVDVVVLSYNGLQTTSEFLEYFYANTDPGLFHLIIVDNGSTDGTALFLEKFAEEHEAISVILNEKNLGVIEGRNLGYNFSEIYNNDKKNHYLMFLDNDQFVQSGWLEQYFHFIEQGYDLISIEAWQMNYLFMPIQKIHSTKQSFSYVGAGGMMMRKNVPDSIGMFDEIFSPAYFEDPDYIFRSHEAGFKIGWNYKAKVVHLPHQTLGKLDQRKKHEIFINSMKKFQQKWRGKKPPIFYQKEIA